MRRMKARMGPIEAITATAHKMARALYFMMVRKTDFLEAGGNFYEKLNHEKSLKFLKKKAESLGYVLQKQ